MFQKLATPIALLTTIGCGLAAWSTPTAAQSQARPSVFQTTLEEPGQKTPEITTEQLVEILATGSEPVFDVRTAEEFAIAHIPGAINIYEKEVERITELYPDPATKMILYCNGPSCGKSKRTSEQLLALGYVNVRRYQLGIPVWRALSFTVQTNMPGLVYILRDDHTSVFVDARTPAEFKSGTIPGAVNIQPGEATAANDDGRLPFRDKSTRVVIFGGTMEQARTVGAEVAKRAYWSSSYFGGTFDDLLAAGLINHPPTARAKNASIAAGAACTAAVNAVDIDDGSSDADAGDTVTLSVAPAGELGLGQHPVTLTATDRHGVSSTASAIATVADLTGPQAGAIGVSFGRSYFGWVLVTLNYTAADNCSPVTAALTVADRDGSDASARVVDARHVWLRDGRRYVITIALRDAAGNQSTITKSVRVVGD